MKAMEGLEKALDEQSFEWMLSQHPGLAMAIDEAVRDGATAEQIKQAVMRQTRRVELALRCEQVARYLVGE